MEKGRERERECETMGRIKEANVKDRGYRCFNFPFPEYKTDPYSYGNPMYTICSRGDLLEKPEGGGCFDTKVSHDHELGSELFHR